MVKKTPAAHPVDSLVNRIMSSPHRNSAPLPLASAKKVIVNFLSDLPVTQKEPQIHVAPHSFTVPAIRPKD